MFSPAAGAFDEEHAFRNCSDATQLDLLLRLLLQTGRTQQVERN